MSANLITGNLFKPIYAYQDADYQAGISGNVTSIMPVGSQMALSIEDANTIKADDGVLITKEGRRIQIDAGAIEEWSIPTGTQGATNYFIIGFHLYTDSNSAEVCETFVEQMENATDTIPEDTFRGGATEVYVSLGRVVQNGINLDSVTRLVQIAKSFEDVRNAIAQLNSDLDDLASLPIDITGWNAIPIGTHGAGVYRYTFNTNKPIRSLIFVMRKSYGTNETSYEYSKIKTPFNAFLNSYYNVATSEGDLVVYLKNTNNNYVLDVIKVPNVIFEILYDFK